MMFRRLLCLMVACSACHSEPFSDSHFAGLSGPGPDIQLTFNPEQDYWPAPTEDGAGVMYSFVDASQPLPMRPHRCMGLMPVRGGTRVWEYCDNRVSQTDSTSSFPTYALGADGRLLYVEAAVETRFVFASPVVRLWLADSAHPYRRRELLSFPVIVGDSTITALVDLHWIGPNDFVALAQRWVVAIHCIGCVTVDSVFYGTGVVHGVITDAGASLTPIAGTAGASGFAVAENGATIVFTYRDSTVLMKVPVAGGPSASVATVTPRTDVHLLGVSCRNSTCVVAVAPVTLWRPPDQYSSAGAGPSELRAVSLTSGEVTTVLSRNGVLCDPVVLASGDVIAQTGAMFGHLQTSSSIQSDLHLFKGLLP
jgi:hypothetical protein